MKFVCLVVITKGTNFIRTPGGDQFHEIIKIRALSALLINFIRIYNSSPSGRVRMKFLPHVMEKFIPQVMEKNILTSRDG